MLFFAQLIIVVNTKILYQVIKIKQLIKKYKLGIKIYNELLIIYF